MISRTASALRSWLLTSVPTPICPCKPFSCKACPGIHICGTIRGGARRGGGAGSGYGRCGGSRYSWSRCGGSREGVCRLSSSEPLWWELPRVGAAWQRNTSIALPGNCLGLSLGQKMIVFRRSRVHKTPSYSWPQAKDRSSSALGTKLELDVGHKTNPSYGTTS